MVEIMASALFENVFWIPGFSSPILFTGHTDTRICPPPPNTLMIALQAEAPSGWEATHTYIYKNNSKLVLGNWYNTTHQNVDAKHWSSFYIPYASAGFIQSDIFTPYHLLHKPTDNVDRKPRDKSCFIGFMQNNCFPLRQQLWDMVVKLSLQNRLGICRALSGCYGSFKNTSKYVLPHWPMPGWKDENSMMGNLYDKKVQIFSDFRFVLCTQNNIPNIGYITHRISDAFMSGAIPVFLGDWQVTNIFNKDAMIQFDQKNLEVSLQKLLAVATNRTLYDEMRRAPVLSREQACKHFSWHTALSRECDFEQHKEIFLRIERLLQNQNLNE
jgi:hypothetical protein